MRMRGAGGPGKVEITHLGAPSARQSGSNLTFSSLPIGPAYPGRLVVVMFGRTREGGVGSALGCTIGGVAAQLLCDVVSAQTRNTGATFYAAVVPSGATADVTVQWGATYQTICVPVSLKGVKEAVPYDFDVDEYLPGDFYVDTKKGGVLLGVWAKRLGVPLDAVWSGGMTGFALVNSSPLGVSAAYLSDTPSAVNAEYLCTGTDDQTNCGALCSFR